MYIKRLQYHHNATMDISLSIDISSLMLPFPAKVFMNVSIFFSLIFFVLSYFVNSITNLLISHCFV